MERGSGAELVSTRTRMVAIVIMVMLVLVPALIVLPWVLANTSKDSLRGNPAPTPSPSVTVVRGAHPTPVADASARPLPLATPSPTPTWVPPAAPAFEGAHPASADEHCEDPRAEDWRWMSRSGHRGRYEDVEDMWWDTTQDGKARDWFVRGWEDARRVFELL